jgi:16S rRNA (guanine527-N7)-methyltransferase
MFRELLFNEFRPYAELSESQLDSLQRHYELLVKWNQRLNLTRVDNLLEVVQFHYCESMFLGMKLPPGPLRVADVGSGAGFPGIPIAILRPEIKVTLIESHQRKAVFLREAARELANAEVLAVRAAAVRSKFDWMISRAVSGREIAGLELAPNSALLVGRGDPSEGAEIAICPWGKDRAVAVSRGT